MIKKFYGLGLMSTAIALAASGETAGSASEYPVTYQHKRVQRYMIGRFEFKDGMLTLKTPEDEAEFLDIMAKQPARESAPIQKITQQSLDSLQAALKRRSQQVQRGAQSSHTVLSAAKGSTREVSSGLITEEDVTKAAAEAADKARQDAESKAETEKAELRKQLDEMKAKLAAQSTQEEPAKEPETQAKTQEVPVQVHENIQTQSAKANVFQKPGNQAAGTK